MRAALRINAHSSEAASPTGRRQATLMREMHKQQGILHFTGSITVD
jgi:hypothetical protein